jgi:hypothetical protein
VQLIVVCRSASSGGATGCFSAAVIDICSRDGILVGSSATRTEVVCSFPQSFRETNINSNPLIRVLFEKLIFPQPGEKFSAFYKTQKFIVEFTRACQPSLF